MPSKVDMVILMPRQHVQLAPGAWDILGVQWRFRGRYAAHLPRWWLLFGGAILLGIIILTCLVMLFFVFHVCSSSLLLPQVGTEAKLSHVIDTKKATASWEILGLMPV